MPFSPTPYTSVLGTAVRANHDAARKYVNTGVVVADIPTGSVRPTHIVKPYVIMGGDGVRTARGIVAGRSRPYRPLSPIGITGTIKQGVDPGVRQVLIQVADTTFEFDIENGYALVEYRFFGNVLAAPPYADYEGTATSSQQFPDLFFVSSDGVKHDVTKGYCFDTVQTVTGLAGGTLKSRHRRVQVIYSQMLAQGRHSVGMVVDPMYELSLVNGFSCTLRTNEC